jgi:hypothetical protein
VPPGGVAAQHVHVRRACGSARAREPGSSTRLRSEPVETCDADTDRERRRSRSRSSSSIACRSFIANRARSSDHSSYERSGGRRCATSFAGKSGSHDRRNRQRVSRWKCARHRSTHASGPRRAFLCKPFTPSQLVDAVHALLAEAHEPEGRGGIRRANRWMRREASPCHSAPRGSRWPKPSARQHERTCTLRDLRRIDARRRAIALKDDFEADLDPLVQFGYQAPATNLDDAARVRPGGFVLFAARARFGVGVSHDMPNS